MIEIHEDDLDDSHDSASSANLLAIRKQSKLFSSAPPGSLSEERKSRERESDSKEREKEEREEGGSDKGDETVDKLDKRKRSKSHNRSRSNLPRSGQPFENKVKRSDRGSKSDLEKGSDVEKGSDKDIEPLSAGKKEVEGEEMTPNFGKVCFSFRFSFSFSSSFPFPLSFSL